MRTRAWLCVAALPVVALAGACAGGDDSEPASAAASKPSEPTTVLKVTDTSTPGNWSFDKKSLTAKAGKVTIEFHNPSDLGHNVRVQSGKKCCFGPDSKDLGGTEVIGGLDNDAGKTARATLNLKPGRYWFLCPLAGHWQAGQRGSLVVN
jgi:plastocyanin